MTDNMNDINENEVTPEEVSTEVKNVSGDTVNAAKVMKKKDIGEVTKRQTAMKVAVQVGLYIFLGIMAIIVLFPFYWMIISSLKTLDEYNASVPTLWPEEFRWANYSDAFAAGGLNLGKIGRASCRERV